MDGKISISAQLRAWLEPTIADEDKVDIAEHMDEAVDHFKRDEEFVEQFLRENLYSYLVAEARKIMARGRPLGNGKRGTRRKILEARGILQTEDSYDKETAKSEPCSFDDVWHAYTQKRLRLKQPRLRLKNLRKG